MRVLVPAVACVALLASSALAQFSSSPQSGKGPPSRAALSKPALPTGPTGGSALLGPGGSDQCATAQAVSGDVVVPFDQTLATTGPQGQVEGLCLAFSTNAIGNDVWFAWTPAASGMAVITTCSLTTVDTKIAAYPGPGCPANGSALACNDDACSFQSTISFQVNAGSIYMVQIGTYPGASAGTGSVSMSVDPLPANDDCSTPDVISGDGFFAFNNLWATTGTQGQVEALCYQFGTTIVRRDVWFTWTPSATGMATMRTCGSTVDTRIAAYPGSGCPPDGSALACNDDACAIQSSINFPVTMGSTYTLQIGVFPNAPGGSSQFELLVVIPPATFCDGDGSGTPCPCGNDNDGSNGLAGCANSVSAGGGRLVSSGANSIAAANLVLLGSNLQPGQAGLYLQGKNAIAGGNGIPFGDGLRCAGGDVVRLQIRNSGMLGTSFTTANIVAVGGVSAGDTRRYQLWYRDTAGPCGSGFNFTNGLEITWAP